MATMDRRIKVSELRRFCESILVKVGVSQEDAFIIADSLIFANLRGIDSHGIIRFPFYLKRLVEGETKITPTIQKIHETTAAILLDGDELRKHLFPDSGYSQEDRERNTMFTARIAALLEEQGFIPIVAKISGRKKWRQEARKLFKSSKLVYVEGGTVWDDNPYEEPDAEELKDA